MQRDEITLTDNNRADARMIEDPSSSYVGDAHAPVTVPDRAQDRQQLLEKWPISPCFEDHV